MQISAETSQKPLVFMGEFRPVLDGKNRVTIPARWRPEGRLEELFLVKSINRGCIAAFTQEGLAAWGEKAAGQAMSVADHEAFMNQFFACAVPSPVDSQGRMVLTDDLKRFAGLTKEAVLAGSGPKFDIWSPELWSEQQAAVAPTFQTILKSIGL
jgi:MraZ protein